MDGSDGGRVTPLDGQPAAIFIKSIDGEAEPSLKLGKSRLINNFVGVELVGIDKASIRGNMLINNTIGVEIFSGGNATSANGNMISGNTILGVPSTGSGVHILYTVTAGKTILKTMISKNTFVAAPYTDTGTSVTGVHVQATGSAISQVTATVSGNSFYGFPPTRRVYNSNGFSTVVVKGNDALP